MRKGNLGFGLVNIAYKMYKACESHDVAFHNHHAGCLGAVGQQQVCKECGETVAYADIVKGVERDGNTVIVTPEEIKALDDEQGSAIDVLAFVHADEIDPILYEGTYYLDADKGSEKGYALLRVAMVESERIGIVRYALRQRTHMGVLRVIGNVLALHPLVWADEIRSTAELLGAAKAVELSPKEVKLAHALVESMMGVWEPDTYVDTYVARLNEMVDTKASGGEFVAAPRDDDGAEVGDLLAKLEASVAAKGKRPAKVS
jgi:DNA end-binding protein Ku